jgi:hypothetical protein
MEQRFKIGGKAAFKRSEGAEIHQDVLNFSLY